MDKHDVEHNLVRGFLPKEDPLQHLPSPYNIWDEVGSQLPKLLLTNHFREILKDLPVLPVEGLATIFEQERAMLLLSFFGHAYVWGSKSPVHHLPKAISKPWVELSKLLKRPPILSYASYALHNWRRLEESGPVELGNIVLLQNFLGGLDEEWFVLVHVDIEMKASAALQLFLPIQEAAKKNHAAELNENLLIVRDSLEKMCNTLDRMVENCDPYIYYNRVRPYIHGWKDNPALPEGLMYEGVPEFADKPQKFRGETGAQSSIVPAFDALLGVEHHPDPLRIYLMEMRDYMPLPHRRFIEQVEKNGAIRNFIKQQSSAYPILKETYNACLTLLSRFRQTHLKYAAHYIQKQSQTSLANPTEIGTGGTPFMNYLRKHKDETLEFLIK